MSDKPKIVFTTIEEIYVTTEVRLSIGDKMRVLLGWLPIVREIIQYDTEAGSATTTSSVHLCSPFPKKIQGSGLVESKNKEEA